MDYNEYISKFKEDTQELFDKVNNLKVLEIQYPDFNSMKKSQILYSTNSKILTEYNSVMDLIGKMNKCYVLLGKLIS